VAHSRDRRLIRSGDACVRLEDVQLLAERLAQARRIRMPQRLADLRHGGEQRIGRRKERVHAAERTEIGVRNLASRLRGERIQPASWRRNGDRRTGLRFGRRRHRHRRVRIARRPEKRAAGERVGLLGIWLGDGALGRSGFARRRRFLRERACYRRLGIRLRGRHRHGHGGVGIARRLLPQGGHCDRRIRIYLFAAPLDHACCPKINRAADGADG